MTAAQPADLPKLPLKSKLPILGGTVLISEALIAYFAVLVGFGLRPVPFVWIVIGAAVLGVLCIVATVTLPRKAGQKGMGILLGWIVQMLILAGGIVLGGLIVVALVFGPMWAIAIYWGRRIDREATEYFTRKAEAANASDNQEIEE